MNRVNHPNPARGVEVEAILQSRLPLPAKALALRIRASAAVFGADHLHADLGRELSAPGAVAARALDHMVTLGLVTVSEIPDSRGRRVILGLAGSSGDWTRAQ